MYFSITYFNSSFKFRFTVEMLSSCCDAWPPVYSKHCDRQNLMRESILLCSTCTYDVVVKKFAFAISSSDELLVAY